MHGGGDERDPRKQSNVCCHMRDANIGERHRSRRLGEGAHRFGHYCCTLLHPTQRRTLAVQPVVCYFGCLLCCCACSCLTPIGFFVHYFVHVLLGVFARVFVLFFLTRSGGIYTREQTAAPETTIRSRPKRGESYTCMLLLLFCPRYQVQV